MLGMASLTFIVGAVSLHNGLQDQEDKANLIAGYSQSNQLYQPEVEAEIATVQTYIDTDDTYLKHSGIGLLSSLVAVGAIGALRIKRQDMTNQIPTMQDTQPVKSFGSIQLPQ